MQLSQGRAIVGQAQVKIGTPVLDKKPSIRQNLGERVAFSVGGGSTIEAAVDPGRMHPCSQAPSSKRLTGVPDPGPTAASIRISSKVIPRGRPPNLPRWVMDS